MKEQLAALWGKVSTTVVEHKDIVIKVGGVLIGAALGAVVATAIANAQEDLLLEDITMSIEDAEETE